MSIEIKISKKPVNYLFAINILEKKVKKLINYKNGNELIWFLEHPSIYTGGSSYKKNDILDKNVKIINSNRGGKITHHGPGQLVCYFVIDLKKRNKDLRKFLNIIELSIVEALKEYKIKSFPDRKNIGIWCNKNNQVKKIAAIGIRVRKWIAFHGFSINISNNLLPYQKINPCGLNYKQIDKLSNIKKQNYKNLPQSIKNKLLKYL